MSKTWITADWHLGEDRFEIMQRPFSNSWEMVNHLVANHNAIVAQHHEVIVVGDAVYQKAPDFLKYVKFFNGRKTLVRGNHDSVFTDEDLLPYFEKIVPEGDGLERMVVVDGKEVPCFITHYPTQSRKDRYNLVGHIHSSWKYQLNMFNVGVDVHHFKPLDLEKEVAFAYRATTSFYDDDVWAAYEDANMVYRGSRGKPGSYFKPRT